MNWSVSDKRWRRRLLARKGGLAPLQEVDAIPLPSLVAATVVPRRRKQRDVLKRSRRSGYVIPFLQSFKITQSPIKLAQRVAKLAGKTHKDRVNEFNAKLEALSEHHDIPKVNTRVNVYQQAFTNLNAGWTGLRCRSILSIHCISVLHQCIQDTPYYYTNDTISRQTGHTPVLWKFSAIS